jgi:hypothetical protein
LAAPEKRPGVSHFFLVGFAPERVDVGPVDSYFVQRVVGALPS